MYVIGVLSDTHGLLRPEVKEALKGCDRIFHAGDINKQSILDELNKIAPVRAVRGNNDKEWAQDLPETVVEGNGLIYIIMVHNKKDLPPTLQNFDLVITGHSHKYELKQMDGITYLNPGSCGPRRPHQEITLAKVYIEENRSFRVEKIVIPHTQKMKPEPELYVPNNLGEILPGIMSAIAGGKTVKQISRKYKIPEEFAEQIVRIYLTHPGVDLEGMLQRLGV